MHLRTLYLMLLEAGSDLRLREFGMWAMLSLRIEKGYGIWSREFGPEYTPTATGLDRFIDFDKPRFIGKEAVTFDKGRRQTRRLVTLEIDATDADSAGYEPIFIGD